MPPDDVAEFRFTNVLASAKSGDRAAFDALVDWLETPLLGFVQARGVRHADHVANAALVRVFRGIDGFSGDVAQFRAWTFRITRNLVLTQTEYLPNRAQPVGADHVERVDRMEAALSSLTPDQRDVLLLRVIAGLSVDESAAVIGGRAGAVRGLQHRALTTLRRGVTRTAQHADGVLADETRWFRPRRDEIDAVLGDSYLDVDLVDVAGIVYDLRLAFLSDRRLSRHAALLAFTEAPLDETGEPVVTAASTSKGPGSQTAGRPNRERSREGRRPTIKALTAVTAGVAGKLAFGAAVAAASVGGLHAADVVDVPGLPATGHAPALVANEAVPAAEDTNEIDVVGNEVDEVAADEEREFSASMRTWSQCVSEAAAAYDAAADARDASVEGPPEPFDPECGTRPDDPNADRAVPGGRPEGVPGPPADVSRGRPEGVPGGPPADVSRGRPEGVPGGPPADVPGGPPADVPGGPPADVPGGPPADVPGGPPADVPGGPPADRGGGRPEK